MTTTDEQRAARANLDDAIRRHAAAHDESHVVTAWVVVHVRAIYEDGDAEPSEAITWEDPPGQQFVTTLGVLEAGLARVKAGLFEHDCE